MYFFKNTNNEWVFGNTINDLHPQGFHKLRVVDDTHVVISNINNPEQIDEKIDVTTIFKNASDETYSDLAEFISSVGGFFVKAGVVPATQELDFLLVDYFTDSDTLNYSIIPDRVGLTAISEDTYNPGVFRYLISETYQDVFRWIVIAGEGSAPYVPISQTTIFVHPTTFERYRFNGSTMEVYDDVDGIVPKWLKYEALLTQTGTDVPIARVLNMDEVNYLGNIIYTNEAEGMFLASNNRIDSSICELYISPQTNFGPFDARIIFNANNIIGIICSGYDILFNNLILVKQRLRGAPPKLLSAETNFDGSLVTFEFDKDISYYVNNLGYSIALRLNEIDGMIDDYYEYNINPNIKNINKNKIVLDTRSDYWMEYRGIKYGDVITADFAIFGESSHIESTDLGIFQGGTFPVVNNVVEPPYILDAYTNESANTITLVANKELSEINTNGDDSWFEFYINSNLIGKIPNYMLTLNSLDNKIIIELDLVNFVSLQVGDTIEMSYLFEGNYGSKKITSTDGGVLDNFYNLTITNNLI